MLELYARIALASALGLRILTLAEPPGSDRFELTYQLGERLRSLSTLRFWSQAEIKALLSQAVLKIARCLGIGSRLLLTRNAPRK